MAVIEAAGEWLESWRVQVVSDPEDHVELVFIVAPEITDDGVGQAHQMTFPMTSGDAESIARALLVASGESSGTP